MHCACHTATGSAAEYSSVAGTLCEVDTFPAKYIRHTDSSIASKFELNPLTKTLIKSCKPSKNQLRPVVSFHQISIQIRLGV